MKIGIVGSGIAGLTAASILERKHDVTVLEADRRIGGHTNTIPVAEGNRVVPVDTGFIVFNEPNYPNLLRLFDRLDVAVQDSDMSFSVQREGEDFEYNGTSFDALFAQRSNLVRPKFWQMLNAITRFHREAPKHLTDGLDDETTVRQYVEQHRYSPRFFHDYLVPLGASLWSCEASRFAEFPMRFVLQFLSNHHMLQVNDRPTWKTVKGGSNEYVRRLAESFKERVFVNCRVEQVRRQAGGVTVRLADGRSETFDEVILASHADQSRRMVVGLDSREDDVLAAFPYQKNEVCLHTDTQVLPTRRKAWASWNYLIPQGAGDSVTVTYNMNMLQKLETERTYCVSLNQSERVEPGKVLTRIKYEHPLFVPGREAAQQQHGQLIRRGGVSYCGAYWGFGFHEDGVKSALRVCEAFDMDLDS